MTRSYMGQGQRRDNGRMTMRALLLWLLVTMSVSAASQAAVIGTGEEVGFEVVGTVSSRVFKSTGVEVGTNYCGFHLEVMGSAWHLTINFKGPAMDGKREEFSCDGTNVVDAFFDPSASRFALPVTIQRDGFPTLGYYPDFVWLAYASSDYLDRNQPLYAPWISARDDPRAYLFDANVSRFDEAPRLPSEIEYIVKRSRVKAAIRNPVLKLEGVSDIAMRQRKLTIPQNKDGFRAVQYRVTATTNVGPFVIPLHFEFLNYYDHGPVKIGDRGQVLGPIDYKTNSIAAIISGDADSVRLIEARPQWPELRGLAGVVDRRFQSRRQGIDSIQYFVTNKWIIDVNDTRLITLFNDKKHAAPFITFASLKEVLFWIVFGFVAALPATVWWLAKMRPKHARSETKK